jgi:hypothetical protein
MVPKIVQLQNVSAHIGALSSPLDKPIISQPQLCLGKDTLHVWFQTHWLELVAQAAPWVSELPGWHFWYWYSLHEITIGSTNSSSPLNWGLCDFTGLYVSGKESISLSQRHSLALDKNIIYLECCRSIYRQPGEWFFTWGQEERPHRSLRSTNRESFKHSAAKNL